MKPCQIQESDLKNTQKMEVTYENEKENKQERH
jgi:hypothetical protein